MLRMACSMHLSQRALLRMSCRLTQRDLRTVWKGHCPTFAKQQSTTRQNRATEHVPLESIVNFALSWLELWATPPPHGRCPCCNFCGCHFPLEGTLYVP